MEEVARPDNEIESKYAAILELRVQTRANGPDDGQGNIEGAGVAIPLGASLHRHARRQLPTPTALRIENSPACRPLHAADAALACSAARVQEIDPLEHPETRL
jgi:hypothetical protein